MPKTVNTTLDSEDFEEVRDIKNAHGLTWNELLIEGARALDNDN